MLYIYSTVSQERICPLIQCIVLPRFSPRLSASKEEPMCPTFCHWPWYDIYLVGLSLGRKRNCVCMIVGFCNNPAESAVFCLHITNINAAKAWNRRWKYAPVYWDRGALLFIFVFASHSVSHCGVVSFCVTTWAPRWRVSVHMSAATQQFNLYFGPSCPHVLWRIKWLHLLVRKMAAKSRAIEDDRRQSELRFLPSQRVPAARAKLIWNWQSALYDQELY